MKILMRNTSLRVPYAAHPPQSRGASGFTLIELMITVAIVGILAAIAIPSYKSYILKSRRVEAMSELTKAQTIIERCYGVYFAYNNAACIQASPATTPNGFYTITASSPSSATTYTFTATAAGSQAADTTCTTLCVDQANQKLAFDSAATAQPSCWSR